MKALLVHARFPVSYWGFQYAVEIVGQKATLPPLGLMTLAALLPEHWELRIVDCNTGSLTLADLRWADVVMVGGMAIQSDSMKDILLQARAAGRRTVVGGPAVTTDPDRFMEADVLFQGEAELRIDALVQAIEGTGQVVLRAPEDRPDLSSSPIPRFDLVELGDYSSACLQYSRGCPYQCEFCDIIEIFGRRPRVKSHEQVRAELQALYDHGYRGKVFVVDVNFIGNRRAVQTLLPEVAAWQQAHDYPFALYTEATIDLANYDQLLADMITAGFRAVFLGIETPSEEALLETGKRQNLRVDPLDAVNRLTDAGLEVMAGFIVGFDSDDTSIFALQRSFIEQSPIPLAMVGLLSAPPGTALWRRLVREGRLRSGFSGEQFTRTNFEPVMDEVDLLRGYAALMAEVYSPEAYYARCRAHLERVGTVPRTSAPPTRQRYLDFARTILKVGLRSPRRLRYWRLLLQGARHSLVKLEWAIVHAVQGEHLIRYTEESVLPGLELAIAEVLRERAEAELLAS